MNKCHRSIWNESLGAWVATSENTRARGKRSGSKTLAGSVLLAVAGLQGTSALAVTGNTDAFCSRPGGNSGTGTWTCQVPNGTGGFATISGIVGPAGTPSIAALNALMGVNLAVNAIVIGDTNAKASAPNTIAMGNGAQATSDASIAIGKGAFTAASGGPLPTGASIAIGLNAQATGNMGNSIAIGGTAKTNLTGGVVIGGDNQLTNKTSADYIGGVSIGIGARAATDGSTLPTDGYTPVAVGTRANALSDGAVAMGEAASARATMALALGTASQANGANATAVGPRAQAMASDSIAMGNGAQAVGTSSISIGTGNVVTGNRSPTSHRASMARTRSTSTS